MTLYPKINGPYKRDMDSPKHPLIMDDWAIKEFELLRNIPWVGHEKIDGTNIRIHYSPLYESITFGGRTERANIPKELLEYLNNTFTLELMKKVFGDLKTEDVTLFGEGIGHKIQSGGKYFGEGKGIGFVLFDIKISDWWLLPENVSGLAEELDVDRAPIIGVMPLKDWMFLIRGGLKSKYGDFYAEGVVVKPLLELFDRAGRRIITKIKHRDFYNGEN